MKYTCPKCGKIIELSTEALIASEYFTVCPQCLTRLQIVGNDAYVPVSDRDLDLTPPSADNTDDAPTPSNEKQPPAFSPATTVRNAPTVPTTPADDQTAVDPLLGQAINFVSQCNAITPVMLSSHFKRHAAYSSRTAPICPAHSASHPWATTQTTRRQTTQKAT